MRFAASLDAMSPLHVLARGYAIASNADGEPIKTAEQLESGELINLRFSDGSADCRVETIST